MCFGGSGEPDYEKPDYGPLPSLRNDDPNVMDQTPKYAQYTPRRTGMKARSFFTRTTMNG